MAAASTTRARTRRRSPAAAHHEAEHQPGEPERRGDLERRLVARAAATAAVLRQVTEAGGQTLEVVRARVRRPGEAALRAHLDALRRRAHAAQAELVVRA